VQAVTGGNGFASESDRRLHFGLGKNPRIDKAVIHWPSGKIQTFENLQPNQIVHVKEPA
jgi:hypothetical protein